MNAKAMKIYNIPVGYLQYYNANDFPRKDVIMLAEFPENWQILIYL